jgi:hypothetical protein
MLRDSQAANRDREEEEDQDDEDPVKKPAFRRFFHSCLPSFFPIPKRPGEKTSISCANFFKKMDFKISSGEFYKIYFILNRLGEIGR